MPAARMVATSRKRSSGDRRVGSAQLDMMGVDPKMIVAREAADASDELRESESRGRMLLTYRTRIRVVGKRRAACADAVKNCRGVVHRGQLRRSLLAGGLSNFGQFGMSLSRIGMALPLFESMLPRGYAAGKSGKPVKRMVCLSNNYGVYQAQPSSSIVRPVPHNRPPARSDDAATEV